MSHAYLRNISLCAFKDAEETQKGQQHNLLISMMFSAFCIEAYLNYLGENIVDFWEAIERNSPLQKLVILSSTIKEDIDFNKRPFSTFREIFKFRNLLAHAKTYDYEFESFQNLSEDEKPSIPLTKWEEMLNLKKAKLFLDDTKQLIETLNKKANLDDYPLDIVEKESVRY